MADAGFEKMSPWTGELEAGPFGATGTENPVILTPLTGLSSASVMARKGGTLASILGLKVPETGRWISNENVRIAFDGPGQWRVIGNGFEDGALCAAIKDAVGSDASVIDQSHGWVSLQISGEMAPDVLAKGTSLDLHLDSFGEGQCAVTQIGHMPVHLTCLEDSGPTYVCQTFRSMTGSMAHWFKDSAAVFGVRIE